MLVIVKLYDNIKIKDAISVDYECNLTSLFTFYFVFTQFLYGIVLLFINLQSELVYFLQ